MLAALYTRVSTDEQVEKGFSLAAQKKRLYEYCTSNNIGIYQLYSDEGISGHSIAQRAALQQMLKDAKDKKFDTVVVYKTDRLSRNLLDLLTIKKELDDLDIELVISDESVDTSDDTGVAMFSIMGAFAELERKKICERLMSGKRQKIRTTGIKPKQAVLPYGYLYDDINKKYIIDEKYRKDIEKIYSLFDEGMSYNQIAHYLVENSIFFGRTTKSKWCASDVSRIIRNPIYKGWTGISYYNIISSGTKIDNEMILVKATNVEAIIDEKVWDRINKKALVKKSYFVRKYPKDVFIFAGLLYCADCGHACSTNQSTTRATKDHPEGICYYYYECTYKTKFHFTTESCKGFLINTNKFNKMFLDFIQSIKAKNSFSKNYSQSEFKTLTKKKDSINSLINTRLKQKEILLEKLMSGTITDDDYKFMSNKVINDIEDMRIELESVNSSIEKIDDKILYENNINSKLKALVVLCSTWDKISDNEKKTILNECIDKIYVNKDGIKKIEFK